MSETKFIPLHQGKNIYLTGFMASGKSTVGKLLASKLQRQFVDTDSFIEREQNVTVKEIFEQKGEAFFRSLETQTLQKFAADANLVVSLGGGTVLREENRVILRSGLWVFIDTDYEVIKERLLRSKRRPLAQDIEKVKALYEERLPVYRQAQLVISGGGDSDQVCQFLLNRILGL